MNTAANEPISARLRGVLSALAPPSSRDRWRSQRRRLIWRWLTSAYRRPYRVTDKAALVVAPHQDDETLGCGGLIALKRAQGVPVYVVFLTDGRRSHDAHPELGTTRSDVVAVRQEEATRALEILGVAPSEIFFFHEADGEMSQLDGADRARVVANLVALLDRLQPEEVFVPHRTDNHPDHRAACALVQSALSAWGRRATLIQYPVWLFWWRNIPGLNLKPAELVGAYRLPLAAAHARKQEAIAAYRSQADILPPGFLEQFQIPYEVFFRPERPLE